MDNEIWVRCCRGGVVHVPDTGNAARMSDGEQQRHGIEGGRKGTYKVQQDLQPT